MSDSVAVTPAIKTFLFDLGNVLVRFSHTRMCEQIGAVCGLTVRETQTAVIESGLWFGFERGKLTEQEVFDALSRRADRSLDFAALRLAGSDIFSPNEGMDEIVASLKRAGFRLVLLSNTCVSHFEFLRNRLRLLDHFDDFVLSYEVGSAKPEPEIFHAALAKIGCDPSECFYTDDIEPFIHVGRSFGLQAEQFVDLATLRAQLHSRGIPCV